MPKGAYFKTPNGDIARNVTKERWLVLDSSLLAFTLNKKTPRKGFALVSPEHLMRLKGDDTANTNVRKNNAPIAELTD